MKQPKILFYDIETFPHLAYVWGKYDQNVIAFAKYGQLASYSYKFQGDKNITCVTREGEKTDKKLLQKLEKLINSADIVVAHNGDEFDQKKTRAGIAQHNITGLRPLTTIDTKKWAKRYFAFPGNSLDDLVTFLKLGKKLRNRGIEMWLDCMADKPAAWQEMATYNKHDVVLLERVFERLKKYVDNFPHIARMLNPEMNVRGTCPECQTTNFVQRRGYRGTPQRVQIQYNCGRCQRWFLGAYTPTNKVGV